MKPQGWSVGYITLALYPFGAGAMAINAFFASLIGSWLGLPILSTTAALVSGALIGLPATYFFARHLRALMDQADGDVQP